MHAAANNEELRQCLLQAAHGQFEVKDAVREIIKESMRSRRSSLDSSGFTIFPGLFESVPNQTPGDIPKEPWILLNQQFSEDSSSMGTIPDDLGELKYFIDRLPSRQEFRTNCIPKSAEELFGSIRSSTDNPSQFLSRYSRITSRRTSTNEHLANVDDPEKLKLLKTRCSTEVIIMILIHTLRLEYSSFDAPVDEDFPKLYVPHTGCRFLSTAKNCGVQVAHQDLYHPKALEKIEIPGVINGGCAHPAYFTVTVGKDPYPIWILPGSQKYVFLKESQIKNIAEKEKLRLVYVPRHSLLVA